MKRLLYIIAVLIVLLFASFRTCIYNTNKAKQNYQTLTDTIKHYKNALGTQTVSIKTLQLSKDELQQLVIKKDKELKVLSKEFAGIKSIVKYKSKIIIDSIPVYYKDSIPCIFERSGEVKNNWYSFTYQSDQKGVKLDSLQISTESTIITGYKRKWFLGKQTMTTDIINSNPYLKIDKIIATEVTIQQAWYKKWYLWLIGGTVGGFFMAN